MARPSALIFGKKQPWDKEIQICANKGPGGNKWCRPKKGAKKGKFFKILMNS